MARILVHALGATAGGGLTYLANLLDQVRKRGARHEWLILAPGAGGTPCKESPHLQFLEANSNVGGVRRVLFDQVELFKIIRSHKVDLVLATGNFGMLRPPVPQVLLNRNALYFSNDHIRELRRRRDFRNLLGTVVRRRLAIRSIRASQTNVTPTKAFADEIQDWIGGNNLSLCSVPFGFDHGGYARKMTDEVKDWWAARVSADPDVRRILMVSHYNYFRNFDTLFAAFALLKQASKTPVELVLTTRIQYGRRAHRYDASATASLIRRLGIRPEIRMLGAVPHAQLPAVYAMADVVVCPSYAESFGHPMVEAMARGRPIVASNRAVHREICGDAALYASTFDAEEMAYRMLQVLEDAELARTLSANGRERSRQFCWERHFTGLTRVLEDALSERMIAI